MNRTPPWVLICSLIIGGGLQPLIAALGTALPHYATVIGQVTGIVVAVAGLVYTYYQAVEAGANAPAKSLAQIPGGNIPVVDSSGATVSTVVTTDSTKPFIAPKA